MFAFVFGRGDVNVDMEKRRFRAIGLLLRQNKGAVFGEQVGGNWQHLGMPRPIRLQLIQ